MSQNVADFPRTTNREQAAVLVAEGRLTNEAIAARCGVTRRSIDRWKQHPVFQSWVEEHRTAQREAIRAEGIANKQNRINALNCRWAGMQQVITERAEDPEMADIPGGKTGLLVKQLKSIGFGENNTVVEEYAVDTGLLKELRAHEQQAAQELGQWTESKDVSGDIVLRVVYDSDGA